MLEWHPSLPNIAKKYNKMKASYIVNCLNKNHIQSQIKHISGQQSKKIFCVDYTIVWVM